MGVKAEWEGREDEKKTEVSSLLLRLKIWRRSAIRTMGSLLISSD